MASVVKRPTTLIYEETTAPAAVPADPTLPGVIAGPAYFIQDYPEDAATIGITPTYGTLYGANPYTAPTGTALTVNSPPGNLAGALLDPASVYVVLGAPHVEIAKYSTGTMPATATTAAGAATLVIGSGSFVTDGVLPGDIAVLTDGSAHTVEMTVRTVTALTVTFTSEFPTSGGTFVPGSSTTFRFERVLPDTKIDSSFVSVDGSLHILVAGSVTVPVGGVAKTVNYASVMIGYRSLRQDLAKLTTLQNATEIATKIGRIDARNPLAVGLSIAFQNTSTPLSAFGILTDNDSGFLDFKAKISAVKDDVIYAIGLCTTSVNVLESFGLDCANIADPAYVVAQGISQKFRVVAGGVATIPTSMVLTQDSNTGSTAVNGSVVGTNHTITDAAIDFIAAGVLPGDNVIIAADTAGTSRNGTYKVAQVLGLHSILLDATPPIPGGVQAAISANLTIKIGTTSSDRVPLATGTLLATAADPALFLDLQDPAATFIDSGVIVGDLIKIPKNPAAGVYTTFDTFVIGQVVSNQRLRLTAAGQNTSTTQNELPHGATRTAPVTAIATSNTLHYEIVRTLDKDGQVTAIIAAPASIANKRVTMCYPDLVGVHGLVDGSLTRASLQSLTPTAAPAQPGYYLACALIGLTVSQPSQQGFTNMSVAGFDYLDNVTPYFSESQVSKLSNNGLMVFQQDSENALPYIIHQVTTDSSSLGFSEFSMVKNFDFVAIAYRNSISGYVGKWNINPTTLAFMQGSLQEETTTLKKETRDRIGAPITDGKVVSVTQSEVDASRAEAVVEANFPVPLNTAAVHVVSSI